MNACMHEWVQHGVGAALNVHEGPQSVSPRFGNMNPLRAGMVLSNEPGFYSRGEVVTEPIKS